MSSSTPARRPLLSSTELCVRYDDRTVLHKATLSIHEEDRIGLVGANGSGKSTFLKILAGQQEPDSGTVARQTGMTVGYLPQDFELNVTQTIAENIRSGAQPILDLIAAYEKLPHDSLRAEEMEHHIQRLDGWNLDTRIKSVMNSLRVPDGARPITNLSGGEKRRVALCRALIAQPDLLILDEPTNHLDTESIEWIEDFLANYTGACLLVTHDRYFLDRVTNRIVELWAGGFYSHYGNYSEFLVAKAERMSTEEAQEHNRQRFLQRELDWVRRAPKARTTKSKSRVDRYFAELEKAPPQKEMSIDLLIPPPPKIGNRIVELKDVTMELGGRTLMSDFTFNFQPGTRIGVVGRNGIGKSTLLKLITGQLTPTRGTVERGAQTIINHVDQSRLMLDETHTVYEEAGQGAEFVQLGAEKLSLRAYLKRFLFTDDRIHTFVSKLSGGERSRLLLARILKNGGNFLILDEPTNDLDLNTLRVLEEALAHFPGCVLVVSHDRYFLNRVCNGIIAFRENAPLFYTVGNYDYYMEKRDQSAAASASVPAAPLPIPASSIPPAVPKKSGRKLNWKEQREWEGMEKAISAAEEKVTAMEARFQDPQYLITLGAGAGAALQEIEKARAEVAMLFQRWEELEAVRLTAAE